MKVESCVNRAVPLLSSLKAFPFFFVVVVRSAFNRTNIRFPSSQLSPGSVGFSPLLNSLPALLPQRGVCSGLAAG